MMSLAVVALSLLAAPAQDATRPPNIVIVLADDLGSGDPGHANPSSRISTPHMDRLARQGMRFTDAHSPSGVCSPTRYALLTGRYAWRSSLKSGVLWGHDPCLLEPDRPTIASMLSDAGWSTGGIGKWHLGLGDAKPADFNAPLVPGPSTFGFDRYVGIPSSLDIPPYGWIIDDRLEAPLTEQVGKSEPRRRGGDGFIRAGAMSPGFDFEDVLPRIGREAVTFISEHAQDASPFLLYVPLTAPHTPWMPTEPYQGASEAGWYGDFVTEVDATLGVILDALDAQGIADDTLVVLTSDNGAHWLPEDIEQWGHAANGTWRGQKADIHEGGHRVPMLVRWPGHVPANSTCDQVVCLVDWYATCRALAGIEASGPGGEDSMDLSLLLKGVPMLKPLRDATIHHSMDGMFAVRSGPWKLIEGRGSGGFTAPRRLEPEAGEPAGQLYNLAVDPGETTNLYAEHPEIVATMQADLDRIRAAEGSTPGR
ncbi:MAG: arylsulfatase [Phycisphaerales bacterium]|nr:arylsulfatase [Phycisphaerales bacterium]